MTTQRTIRAGLAGVAIAATLATSGCQGGSKQTQNQGLDPAPTAPATSATSMASSAASKATSAASKATAASSTSKASGSASASKAGSASQSASSTESVPPKATMTASKGQNWVVGKGYAYPAPTGWEPIKQLSWTDSRAGKEPYLLSVEVVKPEDKEADLATQAEVAAKLWTDEFPGTAGAIPGSYQVGGKPASGQDITFEDGGGMTVYAVDNGDQRYLLHFETVEGSEPKDITAGIDVLLNITKNWQWK